MYDGPGTHAVGEQSKQDVRYGPVSLSYSSSGWDETRPHRERLAVESSNRTRKRVPGSEGAPDAGYPLAGEGAQRGAGPRAGDQQRQHRRWECPAVDRARTHPWQRSGTEQLLERTARGTGRTGSLRLARVPLDQCDWEAMDRFGDRVVFQTEPWLQFIARSQRAEPVVAALRDGHATVGWFTGAIVRRCGVRILGSPFAGWGTQYLGFNLLPNVDRRQTDAFLMRLKQANFFARTCIVQGAPHYWMGDPIDEARSYSGFMAPRLIRFLKERL